MQKNDFKKLFVEANNKFRSRKQCFHYDAGDSCDHIIKAHSIQKGNHLKGIAEGGKVYMLSSDWTLMRRSNDRPNVDEIGINKASTFQGFCKRHDNNTFVDIDNNDFHGTTKELGLHIYRSTCKEFHEQEISYLTLKYLCENPKFKVTPEYKPIASHLAGVALALDRHLWHKEQIETSIREGKYDDFQGVTFYIEGDQNHHFSSITHPIYDFQGNALQDLLDRENRLDILYFFSSPTTSGWAFTFGWHKSSGSTCSELLNSLKVAWQNDGQEVASDMLYRFLFSSSENQAIRISWWNGITDMQKEATLGLVYEMLRSDRDYPSDFLQSGVSNIPRWKIADVKIINVKMERRK